MIYMVKIMPLCVDAQPHPHNKDLIYWFTKKIQFSSVPSISVGPTNLLLTD